MPQTPHVEKHFTSSESGRRSYRLGEDMVASVVASIRADNKRWVDFMMRFELGLEQPDPKRQGTAP